MLWLLLACATAPEATDPPADNGSDSGVVDTGECSDGTELTWENFGEQFFVDYCEICHNHEAPAPGVPADMVFDDEAYVWSLSWRIMIRVVEAEEAMGPEMPPPEDPPTEDMAIREFAINKEVDIVRLGEWFTCGTPPEG